MLGQLLSRSEIDNLKLSKDVILKDILERSKDSFKGLGCVKDIYQISIDSSVKPVNHRPRKILFIIIGTLKKIRSTN